MSDKSSNIRLFDVIIMIFGVLVFLLFFLVVGYISLFFINNIPIMLFGGVVLALIIGLLSRWNIT